MAIIKCKMCGGDLILTEGSSVAECEFCGTLQTVPSADNEKKLTLFARANRLRAACEFDKAAGIYESIVADFPEEAEAYWGLVLCRYGIEYVDDPATGKKIPTCHRSSFDSVLDDSDLDQALENADAVARKVYRDEARQIEELRKGIIEVSGKEQPYDIFICYKETAEGGGRTLDSVLAQDIYDALTGKGYRVFFSRITLEDKLGREYEPYIFAALNSAKIMLAVGTDYEHFNAVWVKNEWSRYLKLMAKDKEKHLIPCFKDIDAYDMPKEFAKLQAQDLSKIGATQDLLRGIEKLLPKKEQVPEWVQGGGNVVQNTVTTQLKRAYQFLADEDWKKADEYLEKTLDISPECAEAYMGKLMLEFRVMQEPQLGLLKRTISNSSNYRKVMQFGTPGIKARLEQYNAEVEKRVAAHSAQVKALEAKKQNVLKLVTSADQAMAQLQSNMAAAEKQLQQQEEMKAQYAERIKTLESNLMRSRNAIKAAGIPLWVVILLILAELAVSLFLSEILDFDGSYIALIVGVVTMVASSMLTSKSKAAALIANLPLALAFFLLATIIVASVETQNNVFYIFFGGIIDTLFAMITGDDPTVIDPEHWQMGRLLAGQACMLLTLVVSIVLGYRSMSDRADVKKHEKQLQQVKQEQQLFLEKNATVTQQLVAYMNDLQQKGVATMKAHGKSVLMANDEYLRMASDYHLKPEQLLPERYR